MSRAPRLWVSIPLLALCVAANIASCGHEAPPRPFEEPSAFAEIVLQTRRSHGTNEWSAVFGWSLLGGILSLGLIGWRLAPEPLS